MKPRDLFRVSLATVCVVFFIWGLLEVGDSLLFSMGLSQLQHTDPKYYGFRGVIEIFVSILVLKGHPPFVDIAFPENQKKSDSQDEDKTSDS
jgi:hypothetical protein